MSDMPTVETTDEAKTPRHHRRSPPPARPRLRPYSRKTVLAKMDNRSREARLMGQIRDDLTAHLGGKPSATQTALIERAAWLSLHVAQLDAKIAECGAMTEHDSRTYLAWSNTLTRTLAALGLTAAPAKVPSLAELLAEAP